jgi:hypothetical protein
MLAASEAKVTVSNTRSPVPIIIRVGDRIASPKRIIDKLVIQSGRRILSLLSFSAFFLHFLAA